MKKKEKNSLLKGTINIPIEEYLELKEFFEKNKPQTEVSSEIEITEEPVKSKT